MPEPYGSPEFRQRLRFPPTKVGAAIERVYDGLGRTDASKALLENGFKAIGMGKPGEKPLDPIPFSIGKVGYTFSSTPRLRTGFVVDDTVAIVRGEDSLFLQVSHSESDPTRIKDEAILKIAGKTLRGDEALEGVPGAFPEITPAEPRPVVV